MAYLSTAPLEDRYLLCYEEVSNSSLVGEGTIYPFGYTLEEWIYLLYRVKKFEFSFDASFLESGTNSAGRDWTRSWSLSKSSIEDARHTGSWGDEASLGCLPASSQLSFELPGGTEANAGQYCEDFSPVVCSPRSVQYGFNPVSSSPNEPMRICYPLGGLPKMRKFEGKLYPAILYSFTLDGPTVSVDRLGDPLWPGAVIYRPGFNDQTAKLHWNYNTANGPDFDFELKLTPKEFWPYDPGDTDPYPGKDGSGPVYDSVTGAQLRNPFAIVKRGDGTFYNPLYTPP